MVVALNKRSVKGSRLSHAEVDSNWTVLEGLANTLDNLKNHGAVGDGVTNDSAAISSWLTWIVANRRSGWVPTGTYLMNTVVEVLVGGQSGQDFIKVHGDGPFFSRFVPAKTNTDGCIKIRATDNSANIEVSSVGFGSKLDNRVTGERDAPNGTALYIYNDYGPGEAGYGSHSTHSVIIRGCDFGSEGPNIADTALFGSWGRCLRIDYMWYIKVENCMFRGLSNVNTTTYDPQTRVNGINVAAIDLRSCFAPEIRGCIVNGYYDYGIHHLGEATTGNAEQGGIVIDCVLAAQRNSILIDHSNSTGPTPYHSGFQICNSHINGNDKGIHVVQHAVVNITGCQLFVSWNAENSVDLTAGIYLENAADVVITGCTFAMPGYYVDDNECSYGIYVASTFKQGFVATGCQFYNGGIGIGYHASFPGFVFSSIFDGQTTGAWATMKKFVDSTGYLMVEGGPSDTSKSIVKLSSARTEATVSPRFALVSERTDYAANTTGQLGAYDLRGLNSDGVETIGALVSGQWQNNTSGAEYAKLDLYCLENGTLKSITFDPTNTRLNLPSGYNLSIAFTDVVGPRQTGWGAPTGTPTRTTFATSTVTLPQLAERVKALIDDLTTHGLIGA